MIKQNNMTISTTENPVMTSGYSQVNGMAMYYEIYGQGKPLVLIHGGGSTIQTTFGRVIPLFSKEHQLICVELQAHGRTSDRNTPISFEQDADDVAALLKNLHIHKADLFGFSNGANTALQMAIRHPELCHKIVAASPLLKKNGAFPQFWEFMKNGTFEQMPQQYKDAFLMVNPDSTKLMNMYEKCAERVINFKEFSDDQIKSIKLPVLLVNGDQDVATSEHIVAMSKLIPDCKLAIIPGGHGAYIGEITTLNPNFKENEFIVPLIEKFFEEEPKL
ncbi:alpha/beta hydrolase fold protein [Flavobacterium enshiense DK69]|uniref:Alpha/beta hydrolase n=1 Tax=Flavobacterium enshiense DK69 TaxID=1107311 RepID=V6S5Z7_9FLAO|nr:alpha/beta hydrolase [Flavobacterium enshiense]ESU19805.1 alpha/beta hydrolase fold protein [Flavobacterium enshiense DK69]KGO93104.1 alpha/beta hydrolase [Flavobacterium enshiense DK69]